MMGSVTLVSGTHPKFPLPGSCLGPDSPPGSLPSADPSPGRVWTTSKGDFAEKKTMWFLGLPLSTMLSQPEHVFGKHRH